MSICPSRRRSSTTRPIYNDALKAVGVGYDMEMVHKEQSEGRRRREGREELHDLTIHGTTELKQT